MDSVSPQIVSSLGLTESFSNPGYFIWSPELAAALKPPVADDYTLVLLDFRTFCYPLYHNYVAWQNKHETVGLNLPLDPYQALYLSWVHTLTTIPLHIKEFAQKRQRNQNPKFKLVICDDYPEYDEDFSREHENKPIYWRHRYVPSYKAGRNSKPDEWDQITKAGYEAASKLGIPVCKEPFMEADDIIAQFVRRRAKNQVPTTVIWTVDTDLLQLVSQQFGEVVWYNTPYPPFFRDFDITKAYWLKRWKRPIDHPSEIALDKSVNGDKSDNLPPGTDIGIIDLLYPKEVPTRDFSDALIYPSKELEPWTQLNQQVKVECMLKGLSVNNG